MERFMPRTVSPAFEQGKINGQIGLRARMRLHIGVLGAEQLARAVAGNVLHHVHALAAAVVALAGIALRRTCW